MISKLKQSLMFSGLLATILFLSGCGGGGGTTVTGEIRFGSTKMNSGDKIILMLGSGANSYSAEVGEDGKFKIANVKSGSYEVSFTHYISGASKGPPQTKKYPDSWTVPGGPFTLDLSKAK